jgi:hypothetical protein
MRLSADDAGRRVKARPVTGRAVHSMTEAKGDGARIPAWRSWLDRPLSGAWCAVSWLASTLLFVGIVEVLGGPANGDAYMSTDSTLAIAHGQVACAFPGTGTSVAPLYPVLAGGAAAAVRIGHGLAFPPRAALGPSCANALQAFNTWAGLGHVELATLRLGFLAWLVLLAGVVALLRASGRGRRGWEPATVLVVACLPPVWLCLQNYFHPQDLLAFGLALASLACARRQAWVGAGTLMALALLSQQFVVLVALPLLVLAPRHRRTHFALAGLLTATLVTLPIIAVSSGRAAREVLIGTGDSAYNQGTLLAELHLQGALLFMVSRLLPVLLSLLLAMWVVNRLGRRRALEPILLLALVALSLSLRLVFDPSLYGYYFMALAVALVLLAVVDGRLGPALPAWLLLVSLVFTVGPASSVVLSRVSWEHGLRHALPPTVLVLAILIGTILVVRDGPTWSLLVWGGLAIGAGLVWASANHPLDTPFTTVWGQLALVLPGVALAALPLYRRVRSSDPPLVDKVPVLTHG